MSELELDLVKAFGVPKDEVLIGLDEVIRRGGGEPPEGSETAKLLIRREGYRPYQEYLQERVAPLRIKAWQKQMSGKGEEFGVAEILAEMSPEDAMRCFPIEDFEGVAKYLLAGWENVKGPYSPERGVMLMHNFRPLYDGIVAISRDIELFREEFIEGLASE